MKRWFAAILMMLWGITAGAGTRPVSLGLNANWEHFLARSANVGWVRIDFAWSSLEPSRNNFDWTEAEAHVTEAESNGLKILAILHYVPSWANGGGCQGTPPLTTADWAEFVKQLAIKYSGRIAAYEIWNEPDTGGNCGGIGWNRNVEEPPLYTDFVHAASQMIRTYSPGSLVVGPAYRTHNDGGADNRKRRFFQQMNATFYPDGHGPDFLDVLSFHNNAGTTEPSRDMGLILKNENLSYLTNYLPTRRFNPVWVTEYGWKSNYVTNNGQREKECNETKIYTGLLEASYTGLGNYNIDHSFIYVEKDGTSASIFNGDNTPKPVVTQYLQKLAFPAVQQPALSADYPNCNGTSFLQPEVRLTEARTGWKERGLQDPLRGLPEGFAAFDADASDNSVYLTFRRSDGAIVSVASRPAAADDERFVSDSAAEWNRGDLHVAIYQLGGRSDLGKDWVRTLAASVDPEFSKACVEERLLAGDDAVRTLGFRVPQAPKGFVALDNRLDLTRMSSGCGAAAQTAAAKDFDFVWSFIGAKGEIVRAGVYRYGDGFLGDVFNPRSLHWSDGRGTRYWVAASEGEVATDTLYTVAQSLDPSFTREPQSRDRAR